MASLAGIQLARRGGRAALGLGLAMLTLVPVAANRRIAHTYREDLILGPSAFDLYLRKNDPEGRFRTIGETLYRKASALEIAHQTADPGGVDAASRNWTMYAHALSRRGTVFQIDFDHGDLSRLQSLRGLSLVASTFLDSGPFFGAVGLRWGIRYRDQQSLGSYQHVRSVGNQEWDEHAAAFPDVRLLEKWREETTALRAAKVIPVLAEGEIVLETERTRPGAAKPGSLRVLEKTPERLVVQSEAPDPTWLFVLRGFWAHRQVTIDGAPVEPVPAQIAFSAVPISAGRHRVEWEETVPGIGVSRWGPVLFGLAAAALFAGQRRRGAAA